MIIVGYYGVGKTTLCKNVATNIDLDCISADPSPVVVDAYADMIKSMNEDGYDVFIQSNEQLIRTLCKLGLREQILIVTPGYSLKEQWATKLCEQYDTSETSASLRSLLVSTSNYNAATADLLALAFELNVMVYCIINMDYKLEKIVNKYKEMISK